MDLYDGIEYYDEGRIHSIKSNCSQRFSAEYGGYYLQDKFEQNHNLDEVEVDQQKRPSVVSVESQPEGIYDLAGDGKNEFYDISCERDTLESDDLRTPRSWNFTTKGYFWMESVTKYRRVACVASTLTMFIIGGVCGVGVFHSLHVADDSLNETLTYIQTPSFRNLRLENSNKLFYISFSNSEIIVLPVYYCCQLSYI